MQDRIGPDLGGPGVARPFPGCAVRQPVGNELAYAARE
jgi:hypothetical protein